MPPTFNGFTLNDSNFVTERWVFKGYGNRDIETAKINRREGIKLLATDFSDKTVTIEGHLLASSISDLQSKFDTMKQNLTGEEGQLILEAGRIFTATVQKLDIPDQPYNQSMQPWSVTFLLSKPFAEGAQLTAVTPVQSGTYTYSGTVNISGTLFNRPLIVYTPGSAGSGSALITTMTLYHVQTGQSITVSGFNGGLPSGLQYQNAVTINLDDFSALEGSSSINLSGGFPKWEPGTNNFTITVSGAFPGGSVSVIYKPRYL